MIAIDYVDLLEQGVNAWNQWRLAHPEERPNLEGAYLFEKSLPGINLSQANLNRACLIGANLTGADLTGANLQGVYANHANFQTANLTRANLENGNFSAADLTGAELSKAVMDNTNLTHTCLGHKDGSVPQKRQPAQEFPLATVGQQPMRVQNSTRARRYSSSQTPPSLPRLLLAAAGVVMPFAIATTLLHLILNLQAPQSIVTDTTSSLRLVHAPTDGQSAAVPTSKISSNE